jgi:hypothetical protein
MPSVRDCHSAVLHNNDMIIFAGGDGYQWLNVRTLSIYSCDRMYSLLISIKMYGERSEQLEIFQEEELVIVQTFSKIT